MDLNPGNQSATGLTDNSDHSATEPTAKVQLKFYCWPSGKTLLHRQIKLRRSCLHFLRARSAQDVFSLILGREEERG